MQFPGLRACNFRLFFFGSLGNVGCFLGISLFEEVVPLRICDIRTKFPQPEVLRLGFNSKRHLERLTKPLEMGL